MGRNQRNRVDISYYRESIIFNPSELTFKYVDQGLSAAKIMWNVNREISKKRLDLVRSQAAIARLVHSKKAMYCLIQRNKERSRSVPALIGLNIEMETEYRKLFGSIEASNCNNSENIESKLGVCMSNSNNNELLCMAYENYRSTKDWFEDKREKLKLVEEDIHFENDRRKNLDLLMSEIDEILADKTI